MHRAREWFVASIRTRNLSGHVKKEQPDVKSISRDPLCMFELCQNAVHITGWNGHTAVSSAFSPIKLKNDNFCRGQRAKKQYETVVGHGRSLANTSNTSSPTNSCPQIVQTHSYPHLAPSCRGEVAMLSLGFSKHLCQKQSSKLCHCAAGIANRFDGHCCGAQCACDLARPDKLLCFANPAWHIYL